MKITEHNTETGETVDRDMTPEELAQYELDQKNYKPLFAELLTSNTSEKSVTE
jgi:hypothetical protein